MRSTRKIWFFRIALLGVVAILPVWPLIALAIILTWVIYIFGTGKYYQGYQGPSLERSLGFEHGKLYRRGGRVLESALAIQSVVEGGVLARAGFQANDVLPQWSCTDFFRYLHRNRGHVVELEVVDGGSEGPPFRDRPRRTLRFAVPMVAEARPTRDHFVAAISIFSPFVFAIVGGFIGYFASQASLPAGPLWAQILIAFPLGSAGFHLGVLAICRANTRA
jgi:hypothetical protein